jgi:hypothetical protein
MNLLTIRQACRFYNLSRPTLLDRIARGIIQAKNLNPGGKYRILRVIPDFQPDPSQDRVKELELAKRLGLIPPGAA